MPYVVTTKRPCPACSHGPAAGGEHRPESVSRRAVATLEEARQRIALGWPYYEATQTGSQALGESGGTVGPLPDGTLIQVAPTTYYALWHAVPWDSGLRGGAYMETEGEQNIAAFNAFNARQSA